MNSLKGKVADLERLFSEGKNAFGKFISLWQMQTLNWWRHRSCVAEFFASDFSSSVNGQHLLVNGVATN